MASSKDGQPLGRLRPLTRSIAANAAPSASNPVVFTPSKGGSLRPRYNAKELSRRSGIPSTGLQKPPQSKPAPNKPPGRSRNTTGGLNPAPSRQPAPEHEIIVITSDSDSDDAPKKSQMDGLRLRKLEKEKDELNKSCEGLKLELKYIKKELLKKNVELAVKNDQADDLLAKANELAAMKTELQEVKAKARTAAVQAERLKKDKASLQREVLKKGKGKRLFNDAEWEDVIQCNICTLTMWKSSTTQCGHTFCASCLMNWFRNTLDRHVEEHPEFRGGFNAPAQMAHCAAQKTWAEDPWMGYDPNRDYAIMQARQTCARMKAEWQVRNPAPQYTCPTCRHVLTRAPVSVLLVKEMVSKVAKLMEEEEPVREQRLLDAQNINKIWAVFFPDK